MRIEPEQDPDNTACQAYSPDSFIRCLRAQMSGCSICANAPPSKLIILHTLATFEPHTFPSELERAGADSDGKNGLSIQRVHHLSNTRQTPESNM